MRLTNNVSKDMTEIDPTFLGKTLGNTNLQLQIMENPIFL